MQTTKRKLRRTRSKTQEDREINEEMPRQKQAKIKNIKKITQHIRPKSISKRTLWASSGGARTRWRPWARKTKKNTTKKER